MAREMLAEYDDLTLEEQTACLWDAVNRGDSFKLHQGIYTIKTKGEKRIVVEDDKGKRYPITIYRAAPNTDVGCRYDGQSGRARRGHSPARHLFMLIEESVILDRINANNRFHEPCGILELLHKGYELQKKAIADYCRHHYG
jgi:hypothetical protein